MIILFSRKISKSFTHIFKKTLKYLQIIKKYDNICKWYEYFKSLKNHFKHKIYPQSKKCRNGGMADARDSKSREGNFMRVRPPLPAPEKP